MIPPRRQLLEAFKGVRVLVVGDVMLDEYASGDVQRISPEAPVPVVNLSRRELQLGGAGNVARNLQALGGHPVLVAGIGDDAEGARLRQATNELGIEHHLATLSGRPTTHKLRVLGRNQHVVRLDREDTRSIDPRTTQALFRHITGLPPPRVLILSDYAKGLLSPELIGQLTAWANERAIPVLVDPKSPDITVYRGATYLTPNSAEALAATGIPTLTRGGALEAGRRMLRDTGARGVLLTRGELGMALVTPEDAHFTSAHRRNVFDVTGAGDTVIATFALCLAAGASPGESMGLANRAAGVVVGKLGAAICTPAELAREAGLELPCLSMPAAVAFADRCRSEGRRVVFTNGCFDVLHAGHVALLEEARARGDVLIVGLNTDASVRRLKGPTRPVQALEDRARILCALKAVDGVVTFDEDTPLQAILALRPDVLVKGGDYRFETIVGAREVTGWGGEVAVVELLENRSTTGILARAGGGVA